MQFTVRLTALLGMAAAAMLLSLPANGADSDLGALELKSAPVEPMDNVARPTKLFVEAAVGHADRRYQLGRTDLNRVSLDLVHSVRLGPSWRAVVSDRLDHIRPAEPGADSALNSLREAYLSWSGDGGSTVVEFGRINLRHGPAYGYNPTDFFRDGALRAVTTANPIALRENRMGTVVVRAQRLWPAGSMALTYSPKLANAPSGETFSLDLGATNNRDRGLLSLNHQWSDRVSGQLLLYKESGLGVQPGASLTALLSDAIVAHAEWSHAREPSLADRAWQTGQVKTRGHRVATGLTYTTAAKLSLTAEVHYSGLALSQSDWDRALATDPNRLTPYLLEAQRRQDLPVRRAYLLYAMQRDLLLKNLDLTALVRLHAEDHSRLTWLDLRYHWANVDLALQLQQHSGRSGSAFGLVPERRIVQLLAAYHFQ